MAFPMHYHSILRLRRDFYQSFKTVEMKKARSDPGLCFMRQLSGLESIRGFGFDFLGNDKTVGHFFGRLVFGFQPFDKRFGLFGAI